MSRPDLTMLIALRSTVTGILSGGVMGLLFTLGKQLPFIWEGKLKGYDLGNLLINTLKTISSRGELFGGFLLGAMFGGILGLVGGLLLGAVTSRSFCPLVRVRLYRVVATTIAAVIAGGGVATLVPLSFSSTPMTPGSAVTIGFNAVLLSLVAGWAAALAAQNIARWYEQVSIDSSLKTSKFAPVISPGFVGVALLAVFGDLAIKLLACGGYRSDILINCVPSPRLYTSISAGFRVALPILLVGVLTYTLLKKLFKRR